MNEKRAQELIKASKLIIDEQKNGTIKGYGRWRNVVESIMLPEEVSFVMKLVKKEKDPFDIVLENIARGYNYEL
jgi:hypothetical protein